MTKVAVVILNYNGRDFLRQFLPSLIEYSPQGSVYVADNKSTDDSLKILRAFPEVNLLELPVNYGYAGGYNEALSHIEAEYFLLVNSDIEVTPNWTVPLLHFLDTQKAYAAVQPKILDYHNKSRFEYAGAAGGFVDPLGYPYCRGRVFNDLETDNGQYDSPIDVHWVTGACFLIRSTVFRQLNGFDASFFAHMEEIDLCWRLKSCGYRAACVPSSVVYHVGGGTLNKTNARKTYLNFRNNLRLIVKNMPKSRLVLVLPTRIILDWLAAFLFWKEHSVAHFTAVLRAHRDALKLIGKDMRCKPRSKPTLDNQKETYLITNYYLKGKKTYKALNSTK